MTPRIQDILSYYPCAARAQFAKTGTPNVRTVRNILSGARRVFAIAGLTPMDPLTKLTRQTFDYALAQFLRLGLSRLTAATYINCVRALFARWARVYYTDKGWRLPKLEFPIFRAQAPRYKRPSSEQLLRVKNWYASLTNEMWLAATLMLEFAMRNGDVLRLRKENFVEKDGGYFLDYVPHKTAQSSGRRIFWPIHPVIWTQIVDAGGFDAFDLTTDTLIAISHAMRRLGFRGNKSAYELRKICIDHIYQHFGAELASSISGDDIKTVTHYYADPSKPNIGNLRIVDLLAD